MMKERLKRRFKQLTQYNKKIRQEKLNIEETIVLMGGVAEELKESGRTETELAKVFPESQVFILDPTNYIELRPQTYFTPLQNWSIAMIKLSVNDVLKPIKNKKDMLNKTSAEAWFENHSYFPGSFRFCCDMVKLDADYFLKLLVYMLDEVMEGGEKPRKVRAIGNRAATGRYFISR